MLRRLSVLWGTTIALASGAASGQTPTPSALPQPGQAPAEPPRVAEPMPFVVPPLVASPIASPPVTTPVGTPEATARPGAVGGKAPGSAPAKDAPAARPIAVPSPEPIVVAHVKAPTDMPLAGWHGGFFLRDKEDYFRLYPRGRMHIDFNSFFGRGVNDVGASDGGNAMKARLFVRRMRLEGAGELFKRWQFNFAADLAGQPLGNANGAAETAAGKPGEAPSATSGKYAPVQSVGSTAVLADNWINYSVGPWFNVQLGQYDAPFSLENRTSDNATSMIERAMPIRGFAFPTNKEIGVMAWGEIDDRTVNYEIGVFGGDGQNRPQVDNRADVIGRVFVRPLKGVSKHIEKAQVGFSGRYGQRDQAFVGYSYPAITTGQGWALWDPKYKDSSGRTVNILPAGAQNAIGGEMRLPIDWVELRGEAYYVSNGTREAIDGYQLTNTERLGNIRGVGWYAQVSAWPWGDAYVNGEPGISRPTKVDLTKDAPKPTRGLELIAVVGGVQATYRGAKREGLYDAKTPGAEGGPGSKISVLEYGLGANYWHTKHLRLSLNYILYSTPGSGTNDNLARVPGNLGKDPDKGAHSIHEIGTRVGVMF